MHIILQFTLLLLSIKVLDSTNGRKSSVCDKNLAINRLHNDIESILFSRTHNLSLRVSANVNSATKNNSILVINNELELYDDLDKINAATVITTTTAGDNTSSSFSNQGSTKINFDNNHSESTFDHSNDTTMLEKRKLLE